MTEKEKEYIKRLGKIFICTGRLEGSCSSAHPVYKEVDIFKHIEECKYADDLQTYMKYRKLQRFVKKSYTDCGGHTSTWYEVSDRGTYVNPGDDKYVDISAFNYLKQEDIDNEIETRKSKYKDSQKYSWNASVGRYGSYVPDDNGDFIYDENIKDFIDIS